MSFTVLLCHWQILKFPMCSGYGAWGYFSSWRPVAVIDFTACRKVSEGVVMNKGFSRSVVTMSRYCTRNTAGIRCGLWLGWRSGKKQIIAVEGGRYQGKNEQKEKSHGSSPGIAVGLPEGHLSWDPRANMSWECKEETEGREGTPGEGLRIR